MAQTVCECRTLIEKEPKGSEWGQEEEEKEVKEKIRYYCCNYRNKISRTLAA
jgi:hypothetical protein